MIQTQLLQQEVFTNILKPNGIKIIEREKTVKERTGFFGRSEDKKIIEKKEIELKCLDDDLISTFPHDIVDQVRNDDRPPSDRGYESYGIGYGRTVYSSNRTYRREFSYTLNEFYKKHNIIKNSLINLEYCKDGCRVSGAYITWDDGK